MPHDTQEGFDIWSAYETDGILTSMPSSWGGTVREWRQSSSFWPEGHEYAGLTAAEEVKLRYNTDRATLAQIRAVTNQRRAYDRNITGINEYLIQESPTFQDYLEHANLAYDQLVDAGLDTLQRTGPRAGTTALGQLALTVGGHILENSSDWGEEIFRIAPNGKSVELRDLGAFNFIYTNNFGGGKDLLDVLGIDLGDWEQVYSDDPSIGLGDWGHSTLRIREDSTFEKVFKGLVTGILTWGVGQALAPFINAALTTAVPALEGSAALTSAFTDYLTTGIQQQVELGEDDPNTLEDFIYTAIDLANSDTWQNEEELINVLQQTPEDVISEDVVSDLEAEQQETIETVDETPVTTTVETTDETVDEAPVTTTVETTDETVDEAPVTTTVETTDETVDEAPVTTTVETPVTTTELPYEDISYDESGEPSGYRITADQLEDFNAGEDVVLSDGTVINRQDQWFSGPKAGGIINDVLIFDISDKTEGVDYNDGLGTYDPEGTIAAELEQKLQDAIKEQQTETTPNDLIFDPETGEVTGYYLTSEQREAFKNGEDVVLSDGTSINNEDYYIYSSSWGITRVTNKEVGEEYDGVVYDPEGILAEDEDLLGTVDPFLLPTDEDIVGADVVLGGEEGIDTIFIDEGDKVVTQEELKEIMDDPEHPLHDWYEPFPDTDKILTDAEGNVIPEGSVALRSPQIEEEAGGGGATDATEAADTGEAADATDEAADATDEAVEATDEAVEATDEAADATDATQTDVTSTTDDSGEGGTAGGETGAGEEGAGSTEAGIPAEIGDEITDDRGTIWVYRGSNPMNPDTGVWVAKNPDDVLIEEYELQTGRVWDEETEIGVYVGTGQDASTVISEATLDIPAQGQTGESTSTVEDDTLFGVKLGDGDLLNILLDIIDDDKEDGEVTTGTGSTTDTGEVTTDTGDTTTDAGEVTVGTGDTTTDAGEVTTSTGDATTTITTVDTGDGTGVSDTGTAEGGDAGTGAGDVGDTTTVGTGEGTEGTGVEGDGVEGIGIDGTGEGTGGDGTGDGTGDGAPVSAGGMFSPKPFQGYMGGLSYQLPKFVGVYYQPRDYDVELNRIIQQSLFQGMY